MEYTKEEIRLQKYLADSGVASRRKSEELITQGKVKVNGQRVQELGTKVTQDDVVEVDGKVVAPISKKVYVLLNKPAGYLTTAQDDFDRPTVMELIAGEIHTRVFPVGRLDFDTEGLLLMTNDGDLAYKLTHPKHHIDKNYVVTLDKVPAPAAIERLRRGVMIEGKKTMPAKIEWVRDNILNVTIREGRNRQVRKMMESVGYEVEHLKRVSMGNIVLGHVPLGRWRHLTSTELNYLKGL